MGAITAVALLLAALFHIPPVFATVLPRPAAAAASARALLGPLSPRSFAGALSALPRTILGGSVSSRADAARVRVDVRLRLGGPVRATLSRHGTILSVTSGRTPTLVQLPVAADSAFAPRVRVRPSFSNAVLVTVVLRTLTARIARAADACAGDMACLAGVAETLCGRRVEGDVTDRAGFEMGVRMCGVAEERAIEWIPRLVYRVLFGVLTVAQAGVILWGAVFAMTFLGIEGTRVLRNGIKRGARSSRVIVRRIVAMGWVADAG